MVLFDNNLNDLTDLVCAFSESCKAIIGRINSLYPSPMVYSQQRYHSRLTLDWPDYADESPTLAGGQGICSKDCSN